LTDANGQPATLEVVSAILAGATVKRTATALDDGSLLAIDLLPDDHPYLCSPCFRLHVCGVAERMALLSSTCTCIVYSDGADEDEEIQRCLHRLAATGMQDERYMLRWLALVGPQLGLAISPSAFNKAFTSTL
jgi:Autophagocytosis associated protein, active-site domain